MQPQYFQQPGINMGGLATMMLVLNQMEMNNRLNQMTYGMHSGGGFFGNDYQQGNDWNSSSNNDGGFGGGDWGGSGGGDSGFGGGDWGGGDFGGGGGGGFGGGDW